MESAFGRYPLRFVPPSASQERRKLSGTEVGTGGDGIARYGRLGAP